MNVFANNKAEYIPVHVPCNRVCGGWCNVNSLLPIIASVWDNIHSSVLKKVYILTGKMGTCTALLKIGVMMAI